MISCQNALPGLLLNWIKDFFRMIDQTSAGHSLHTDPPVHRLPKLTVSFEIIYLHI